MPLPTSIGRYVVEGPLGAGGMGAVLRGRDPDLDRPVAIKLLHAHRSLDEAHRARLVREAQALAALAHPNIVNVFEVGIHGDQAFVAMELVEGLPLHTWTRERLATLDGNLEASRSGGSGRVTGRMPLLDALSGDLTEDGTVVGTPAYMAPEQHSCAVSAATD